MERDYNYHRRHSWSVDVGGIPLGGENPIRIQSMTSTSTDDIEASRENRRRRSIVCATHDPGGERG